MQNTYGDSADFKAPQREQWSNVAQGWRKQWAAFERGAQPLSDRTMELAHIAPGQRVLDVATGIGEPAMTAARRVSPSGSMVAFDQAPQMLAVARGSELKVYTVKRGERALALGKCGWRTIGISEKRQYEPILRESAW